LDTIKDTVRYTNVSILAQAKLFKEKTTFEATKEFVSGISKSKLINNKAWCFTKNNMYLNTE